MPRFGKASGRLRREVAMAVGEDEREHVLDVIAARQGCDVRHLLSSRDIPNIDPGPARPPLSTTNVVRVETVGSRLCVQFELNAGGGDAYDHPA